MTVKRRYYTAHFLWLLIFGALVASTKRCKFLRIIFQRIQVLALVVPSLKIYNFFPLGDGREGTDSSHQWGVNHSLTSEPLEKVQFTRPGPRVGDPPPNTPTMRRFSLSRGTRGALLYCTVSRVDRKIECRKLTGERPEVDTR